MHVKGEGPAYAGRAPRDERNLCHLYPKGALTLGKCRKIDEQALALPNGAVTPAPGKFLERNRSKTNELAERRHTEVRHLMPSCLIFCNNSGAITIVKCDCCSSGLYPVHLVQ